MGWGWGGGRVEVKAGRSCIKKSEVASNLRYLQRDDLHVRAVRHGAAFFLVVGHKVGVITDVLQICM